MAVLLAAGWQPRERTVRGPTGAAVRAAFALSPAGCHAAHRRGRAGGRVRPDPAARRPGPPTRRHVRHRRAGGGGAGRGRRNGWCSPSAAARRPTAAPAWRPPSAPASLDGEERPLAPGGAALIDLARIDVTGLDPRIAATEVVVACDVDNPLTGPSGAAAVYGPQKGATAADVTVLDAGLARLAQVLRRDHGIDVERRAGRRSGRRYRGRRAGVPRRPADPGHRPGARPRRLRRRTGRRRPGGHRRGLPRPPVAGREGAGGRRAAGPGRRCAGGRPRRPGRPGRRPTGPAWSTSASSRPMPCSTSSRTPRSRWPAPHRCCASSRPGRSPRCRPESGRNRKEQHD